MSKSESQGRDMTEKILERTRDEAYLKNEEKIKDKK